MTAGKTLIVIFTATLLSASQGCSDSPTFEPSGDGGVDGSTDSDADGDADSDGDSDSDSDGDTDTGPADQFAELWYSADELLVYIDLNESDGTVSQILSSELTGLPLGQNCVTMLEDGSLLGARLSSADNKTYFWHVLSPPRDGSPAVASDLGIMPDDIMLEALYTDCDGRLYGMDTGTDNSTPDGNRLIRFTGDYLSGDFDYEEISDWSTGSVADIDDMGPGIAADGTITDTPGFAIDTGDIYDFDYELGSGTLVGSGGTWGIHALGGDLFNDGVPRLYVLNSSADLFEVDPSTFTLSSVLGTGPPTQAGSHGWSGLAGPLTDCTSDFIE